jgi:hypothetical protein
MALGLSTQTPTWCKADESNQVYQSITEYAMHKTTRRVANEFHDTRCLLIKRSEGHGFSRAVNERARL